MFDLQGHWGSLPKQVHTSEGWLILTKNSAAFTKIYLFYAGIQHILGLRFGLGGSFGALEMFRHCPSRSLALQTPLARAAALIHSALWQRPPGRVRFEPAPAVLLHCDWVSWSWLALRLLWLLVSSSHWVRVCTTSSPPRGNVIKVLQSNHSMCFKIAPPVLCCSRAPNSRNYIGCKTFRKQV